MTSREILKDIFEKRIECIKNEIDTMESMSDGEIEWDDVLQDLRTELEKYQNKLIELNDMMLAEVRGIAV